MIKYHPTFIGWLIKNKKVEKLEDKLALYTQRDVQPHYIQTYKGEEYHINNDGSKRIPRNCWDKNFTKIKLREGHYSSLVAEGYDIFDLENSCDRYCLTSQIGKLLVHHYDILGDISFPEDFPRLKGEEALAYIKWMESKHDYLKQHNFKFNSYVVSRIGYIGLSGFSDYQPKVFDNIQKFGIFSYKPLYKQIEWTFDLVEKFKNQVVWERLMDDSNLTWEEDKLVKYDKYIPYQKYENGPEYSYDENSSRRLEKYEKLGFLSNSFLHDHIDVLDWEKVLEKCKFCWNKEDLDYFCRYVLNHDEKYTSKKTFGIYGRPLYDVEAILKNDYFEWDADKLFVYLQLHNDFWNSIQGCKKLHKIFMQIPNIREIAQPYINDENFWDIVSYDHDFDYDKLSKEFTIDNIKRNIDNWSIPLKNIYLTMRRTPDTNYYYYYVETQWDIFWKRKNIPLTYELANFLLGINIKLGGTYMESDGGYMEEDHRFPVYNGLEAFSSHHMASLQDTIKCMEDPKIADMLLCPENGVNIDLITLITDSFFMDYDIKDYIDIINGLKNWDKIREFYGDEV